MIQPMDVQGQTANILDEGGLTCLHLRGWDKMLAEDAATSIDAINYYRIGRHKGRLVFRYPFKEDAVLLGDGILRLWMSTENTADLNVFVRLERGVQRGSSLGQRMRQSRNPVLKWFSGLLPGDDASQPGLLVRLRDWMRRKDPDRTGRTVYHAHERVEMATSGEIVPVSFHLGHAQMPFHKGECLELTIAGYDITGGELPATPAIDAVRCVRNSLYTGAEHDSCLQIHMMRLAAIQHLTPIVLP